LVLGSAAVLFTPAGISGAGWAVLISMSLIAVVSVFGLGSALRGGRAAPPDLAPAAPVYGTRWARLNATAGYGTGWARRAAYEGRGAGEDDGEDTVTLFIGSPGYEREALQADTLALVVRPQQPTRGGGDGGDGGDGGQDRDRGRGRTHEQADGGAAADIDAVEARPHAAGAARPDDAAEARAHGAAGARPHGARGGRDAAEVHDPAEAREEGSAGGEGPVRVGEVVGGAEPVGEAEPVRDAGPAREAEPARDGEPARDAEPVGAAGRVHDEPSDREPPRAHQ